MEVSFNLKDKIVEHDRSIEREPTLQLSKVVDEQGKFKKAYEAAMRKEEGCLVRVGRFLVTLASSAFVLALPYFVGVVAQIIS